LTPQDAIFIPGVSVKKTGKRKPAEPVLAPGSAGASRLQERADQYRSLLDSVPGSVARIDLQGKYLFVNKYFLALTGMTYDSVIGRGVEIIRPFIDPSSFPALVHAVTTTMREQKQTEVEIWGTDSSGTRRYLVQVSKPWFDGRKRFAGIEILTYDITQRKCAEEQMAKYHQKLQLLVEERTAKLRQAEKDLEQQNRLLSEKNIALREVMGQLEDEKRKMGDAIRSNMEQLILPQLDRLKMCGPQETQKYLTLLEFNLKEITAGFGKQLSGALNRLTQKEIEICDMIKRGMTCKEIARLQNTSPRTVETHRNRIRKKLGIADTAVNLATFLKNL
jgi:PAS domain S-box-containing protein